jgi:ketosteroid isomerase-like protein
MASPNIDLVRAIFAEWERADFRSTWWADPEIDFVVADGLSPGSWKGLDAMAQAFRDNLTAWENWFVAADEYRELDRERVFVLQHYGGRGRASGLTIGQTRNRGANLFHIRDGKVTRVVCWFDGDRALAELGLKLDDRHPAEARSSVDVVRRLLRAWSDRDFERAALGLHPTVTGRVADPFMGPISYTGSAEVRAWWEQIAHSWEEIEAQIEQVLEAREDLVVLAIRFRARARGSGAVVNGQEQFQVWRLRDGKLASFEFFADRAEAMRSAGLDG